MRSLLLLALVCGVAAASLTETKSLTTATELIGLWKLVRVEVRHPNETVTADPDFGPNATGYISYDQTGHMSVHIMNPDLPRWKDEDHPTAAEAVSTFERGYSAYAGTYEVHEREGFVVHHPELALVPNYVGQTWERKFTIEGDFLRLTPPTFKSASGDLVDETLVWKRVR